MEASGGRKPIPWRTKSKEFWNLGMGSPEDSQTQLDSRIQGVALKSAPRRQLGNHCSHGGQFPEPGLATEDERRWKSNNME